MAFDAADILLMTTDTFEVSVHFSAPDLYTAADDALEYLSPVLDEHFPHWSMIVLPVEED